MQDDLGMLLQDFGMSDGFEAALTKCIYDKRTSQHNMAFCVPSPDIQRDMYTAKACTAVCFSVW